MPGEVPALQTPSLLFVYGTLKPRDLQAATRGGWLQDAVRGRLYDLGAYPGLINLGSADADWIEGYARPIQLAELTELLDPYEGVDEGLFCRRITLTRQGRWAWVYVYGRALPADARGPLTCWIPSEPPTYAGPQILSWTTEPRF